MAWPPSSRLCLALVVCLALVHSGHGFLPSFSPSLSTLSSKAASRVGIQRPVLASKQGLSLGRSLVTTLQMRSDAVTAEDPLKVIVAGGGVGGLFLAKALQKQGIKVTILEKTGKFARFGGPIQ
eukprot:130769-Rhodomonas_salina.1